MKLLLTSAGITNDSIFKKLVELVGKEPKGTKVVYVPTAANLEEGDKQWMLNDMNRFIERGFGSLDIVDIAALTPEQFIPRLTDADLYCFGGGNEFYLMRQIMRAGLDKTLSELLQSRVYMGVSAGSMVLANVLSANVSHDLFAEAMSETEDMKGLGYVPFQMWPHLNSPYFPHQEEKARNAAAQLSTKVYALDDNSAVATDDGKVEIISEGTYLEFN